MGGKRRLQDDEILTRLRELVPNRPLGYGEALALAEIQALLLLRLTGTTRPPVPVSRLVVRAGMVVESNRREGNGPVASSRLNGAVWWIFVNDPNGSTDHELSVAHEFKHIIDHKWGHWLYPPVDATSSRSRWESVAEYFASCLLMPQEWLETYIQRDGSDVANLAAIFAVAPVAMRHRLRALRHAGS